MTLAPPISDAPTQVTHPRPRVSDRVRRNAADDRSLNGVHVNGERVGQATLRDGDSLALGDVQMRFISVH